MNMVYTKLKYGLLEEMAHVEHSRLSFEIKPSHPTRHAVVHVGQRRIIHKSINPSSCGMALFLLLISFICLFPTSIFGEDIFSWTRNAVDSGRADWCSIAASSDGAKIAAVPRSGFIYVSLDGSATWAKCDPSGADSPKDWEHVSISTDGNKILASTRDQLYLSFDEGSTWKMCPQVGMEDCNYIFSASISRNGAKIAVGSSDSIYISSDDGENWTKREPAGAGMSKCWLSIAINTDGEKIVATTANGFVYVSSDGGSSWMQCDPTKQGLIKTWNSAAISSDGCKMVVSACEDFVYASSDSGKNWIKCEPAGEENAKDWSSLFISDDGLKIIAAGRDDFIYVSSDAGSTWERYDPSGTPCRWLSVAASTDYKKIFAGAENSYLLESPDAGMNWIMCKPSMSAERYLRPVSVSSDGRKIISGSLKSNIYSSDAAAICDNLAPYDSEVVPEWTAAISADGTRIAAAAYMGENPDDYIYTSDDGGASWIKRESAGLRKWNCIAISSDGTVICASAIDDFIYFSSDGGASWIKCDPSGTDRPLTYNSLSISTDGAKIAAASSDDCIYLSSDGGISWDKCEPAGKGIQKIWNSVSVSGDGTKIIAAAAYDFLYVSGDGGTSWTKCDPAGEDQPKNWISVSTSGDGAKIAASSFNDFALYLSLDGGTSWEKIWPAKTGNKTMEHFYSVAFSADGKTLAVADAYDLYCGSIYRTVKFIAGADGSLQGQTTQTVEYGKDCTEVTAVPAPGYSFVNWSGDHTGNENPLRITNVTANMFITANFAVNTDDCVLTVDSSSNGTTKPSGEFVVENGKAIAIKAIPDDGYHFLEWVIINGTPLISDFKLAEATVVISGDAKICAVFEINSYTVTFLSGANGSLQGQTQQIVEHGKDSTEVTAVPATGYGFVNWSGDHIGTENPLIITNVTSDMLITTNFASNDETFAKLLISPGENNGGSVNPSGEINVLVGASNKTAIKAIPGQNFYFVEWRIVSGDVAIDNLKSSGTHVSVLSGAEAVIEAIFAKNSNIGDRTRICISLDSFSSGANLLKLPENVLPKDSIRISRARLEGFSFDGKFDPSAKDIRISVDGEVFALSPEKGAWMGDGNRWDYRSSKGVLPRILLRLDFSDADNLFWSFSACNGAFMSIENSDGVDVRISIDGVTCRKNYHMLEKGIFRFRSNKNTSENIDTVLAPMKEFSLVRLNGRYDTGRDEFTLFVRSAKYACKSFDCFTERSQISVDRRDFIFAPGEFKKKTGGMFCNRPGEGVSIFLNPATEQWRFRLFKVSTKWIGPADGLIFRLCLGTYEGAILCRPSSRIKMTYRGK